MRRLTASSLVRTISSFLFLLGSVAAQEKYPASGLVLKVDPVRKVVVISCDAIPGYMQAMTMPIAVHGMEQLANLRPGTIVDFTLVLASDAAFAESLHARSYQGLEPDPAAARRLKLLAKAVGNSAKPLAIGDAVPNFTLTDQNGKAVTLSRFRGKTVVLNFVYTRCALPNFCVRSSNNFRTVQDRFRQQLGRDLVLLTVTFDPVHDSPDVLNKYSASLKADPLFWHFLTGSGPAIRRVCDFFGEDYFPDEGLMDHSLHTAIIDRHGMLVANLEGTQFTAGQVGDLIGTVLDGSASIANKN